MSETTDINGLTEVDRLAAERMEAMIERQRDQSMERIRLQSAQSVARCRANILKLALKR